jgi:hypothetical protein
MNADSSPIADPVQCGVVAIATDDHRKTDGPVVREPLAEEITARNDLADHWAVQSALGFDEFDLVASHGGNTKVFKEHLGVEAHVFRSTRCRHPNSI